MDKLKSESTYIEQSIELAKIVQQVITDERIPFSIRNGYIDKVNEIMEERQYELLPN